MDAWSKLRAGQVDRALNEMIAEYRQSKKDPSKVIQLGVAYMWLSQWKDAWTHFREFIENHPVSLDVMFKFAGTAKWCAGEWESAVQEWDLGLKSTYTDVSRGITIPLHLYFAAAACPTVANITEIAKLLRQSRRGVEYRELSSQYPGLLAHVALGELSLEDAILKADELNPHGKRHRWTIAFWEAVYELASGRKQEFVKKMAWVSNLSWADFDRDRDDFIARLWSSEFFLARYHCLNPEEKVPGETETTRARKEKKKGQARNRKR